MLHVQNGRTASELAQDLRELGVRDGDLLYVHTSLKQIGWLENGPQTLIQAFQEVLGEDGTLAAPTHTLSFPGRGAPPYRAGQTPTVLGAFPEALRQYPGALRSGHASHSSAALGRLAEFLTATHDPCHALGENSPLFRIYRSGGRVLLLGVGQTVNTMLHLAESLAGMPYVRLPYDASWGPDTWEILPDGSTVRHTQVEFPGCSEEFDRMDQLFRQHGIVRTGRVGNARTMLLEAGPMVELTVDALQKTPWLFLCSDAACPCCPARRAALAGLGIQLPS